MISTPQQMLVAFDDTLSRIPTNLAVPQDLWSKIQELYNRFQEDYYFFPWGAEKKETWDNNTKTKWNNNFNMFSSLVDSALVDPRTVKRTPAPKIKITSKTPVQEAEPEYILGKVPPSPIAPPIILPTPEPFNYWWLVGGAAILGTLALLMKKKTMPKPMVAELGLSPDIHKQAFDRHLVLAIRDYGEGNLRKAREHAVQAETHLWSTEEMHDMDVKDIDLLKEMIDNAEFPKKRSWL